MKLPFGSRGSRASRGSRVDDEYDVRDDFGASFYDGADEGGYDGSSDGPISVEDFDGLFDDDHLDGESEMGDTVPPPDGWGPTRTSTPRSSTPRTSPTHTSQTRSAADGPRLSDGNLVPPPEGRGRGRTRRRNADTGGQPVSADDFSVEMERLRLEASAEQRSAWAYLGVLGGLFCFLVVFGYGCSDQGESEVATGEAAGVLESGQSTQLVFRVEGDIITVQGTVLNDAARGQLITLAQNAYGAENVLDELVVDAGFTFDAGTIRTIGSAAFEDGRAEQLHNMISADFGLANRGFEVGFVETVLAAVNAQVELIEGGRVVLSGALPDQQSVDDLVALTGEVWGPTNIDPNLLSVGDTTWTDGHVRVTGTAQSGDQRIEQFVAAVPERFGPLVSVDAAGVAVVDITGLITELNTQIDELVKANPIQFAPLLADIEASSDQVLIELASLLSQLPTTEFEVVGYTDSLGNDQENLLLSQQRAEAVLGRLGDLGIAESRMTSRGEGENDPVADNGTDAGRAANRRIEFVFVGTAGDLTANDTTTTTEA